ncbi:ribosomal protection-like ABC-F family protein [Alicyclobacillus sp. ALC3]|uniref:ribosomal protection-like ABC-F family protein n=1 Tax=Alicyclobacillus sp. ALC3 TaxID=2796143 RepID=UPI002379D8E2|nr:ABC-F family ATP-binding cassette domain-containing protein [Alicyclobacillus sp. ALC3]WDL96107.1 ABC-F family ATP-binding cassette domain-containing protein [Alicyclobacillus sp. ALC3]
MPYALKVDGVSKEIHGQRLFDNVSLEVSVGECVALIGRNGVGKTSFIEGIVGHTKFDKGVIRRGIPLESWGWIEQEIRVGRDTSLYDFVHGARKDVHQLKSDMDRLQQKLEVTTENQHVVDTYLKLIDSYSAMSGYEYEVDVETSLKRLGFDTFHFSTPYEHLSGGQKTRAQIAKLSLMEPEFLVLDEPTNHLDVPMLDWLATWLKSYKGSVVFVSHDRYFIDAVADTTYELTSNGAKRYKGGYSAFRESKNLEIKTQQALYDKHQRERKALLEAIQRYKEWYERGHNAASERDPYAKKRAQQNANRYMAKKRALERLEERQAERPTDGFHVNLSLESSAFDAKFLLRADCGQFSYPDREMFHDFRLDVCKGDKIGIIGPNGAGKSTLLGILTGTLKPQSGDVAYHPQLKIGYFAQELDNLTDSRTVLDTVLSLPGMTETYARTVLAGFLFQKDDVFKLISSLSMGERCRVAFVNLYFSDANLLVLDEPTNYLDIDTRERIQDALVSYPGALIVVSHDRYLLQNLVTRVVWFEGTAVHVFDGTMDEFVSKSRYIQPDIHVLNDIERLELLLTNLLSTELHDREENNRLLAEIRKVQTELKQLRSSR